jgi:hypothetical protein
MVALLTCAAVRDGRAERLNWMSAEFPPPTFMAAEVPKLLAGVPALM